MLPSESPRIGYVVKRYPRYSETFIVNEILAHEAAGLEIDIFALRSSEDTHFQDIISRVRAPVIYLPNRCQKASALWSEIQKTAKVCEDFWTRMQYSAGIDERELVHALALARHIIDRGITHLHAHFATSATTVARLAAKLTGINYSFTAHAKDIFHQDVDTSELQNKITDAAKLVTISDFNENYLTSKFDINNNRLHRIYNGLDLDRFVYHSPARRRPLVLAVGRLVEKKGFRYLIEACRQLLNSGTDFECLIIGEGEEEEELRGLISSLGVGDTVRLAGPQPQSEVITLLQEASVFAVPCVVGQDGNRDGLPTVLLEAMALGTPCVSTNVTGIPEIIKNNETGLLVNQHDSDALAIAIKQLLDDAALRERLAVQARQLIEEHFDVHQNAARIRALFDDIRQIRASGPRAIAQ